MTMAIFVLLIQPTICSTKRISISTATEAVPIRSLTPNRAIRIGADRVQPVLDLASPEQRARIPASSHTE